MTKKIASIFLMLVIFTFCSSEKNDEISINEKVKLETTSISTTSTSLIQVEESTTTTLNVSDDEVAQAFLNYYVENKISGYIKFNDEEKTKTLNLHLKGPTIFFWNNLTCYLQNSGTSSEALLDEYLQVYFENDWYFDNFYTSNDSEGTKYIFRLDVRYYCSDPSDNSINKTYVPLYGYPFFHNETWWVFTEKEFEPVPIDTPGYYAIWAKKIELPNFDEVYQSWVIDSIPPEIVFYNCPQEVISEESFTLSWGIISGNSDINYLRIATWKNDEYLTRVYFEKENVPDSFPFPDANTSTSYEQLITNSDGENNIYEIYFAVSDELNNDIEQSCVIEFKK